MRTSYIAGLDEPVPPKANMLADRTSYACKGRIYFTVPCDLGNFVDIGKVSQITHADTLIKRMQVIAQFIVIRKFCNTFIINTFAKIVLNYLFFIIITFYYLFFSFSIN